MDKLSYEIFSILESKFLSGYGSPPAKSAAAGGRGKVRILSIDGGSADGGLLAGAALSLLESRLRDLSGDPDARIADFFDAAAGSGAGGVLAAMLFTRGPDGRPLLSAAEAAGILAKNRRRMAAGRRKSLVSKILRRSEGIFRRIFGDATVRDAVKPLLIPCYDLGTKAPFVFSRADAVEGDGYDFFMREVCAATCAAAAAEEVASVDGQTRIRAAGGAVAMGNPTAAAITHVLHNKQEFPFVAGVEDLVVLSIGSCAAAREAELLRIAGAGQADMVDQAVALAFGEKRATNYIRIQGNGVSTGMTAAEALTERSVESVLFLGRKITASTNGERLEFVAGELIREKERRAMSQIPTVLIKPAITPRTSSSSSTTVTTVLTASSDSP
ncbi:patatin-like protein 3 [Typha angustifolia]|uniref:patatin-like protein 3 n=1 Tax=Typha angustifolia TaxID=59011 RepID=UPI003C2D1977